MSLTLVPIQAPVSTTTYSILWSKDCKTIYLQDNTGAYNATTNPTGYGSPNLDYTGIKESLLYLTDKNGVVLGADTAAGIRIRTSNFSNVTGTDGHTVANPSTKQLINITNSNLGGTVGGIIANQIINCEYRVEWDSFANGGGVMTSTGGLTTSTVTFANNWNLSDTLVVGDYISVDSSVYTLYPVIAVGTSGGHTTATILGVLSVGSSLYRIFKATTIRLFMLCQGDACVIENIPDMFSSACCTNCGKATNENARNLFSLREASEAAFVLAQYDKANEMIDTINSYCDSGGSLCSCNS